MSNTTNTSEIDRLTMEAAADWFDRLDSLSASERNDLTSWLNASDANKRAFGLIQQTMRDSALLESMAFAPENAQTPEGELAAAPAGSGLQEQAMRAWNAIRRALSPTGWRNAGYGLVAASALVVAASVLTPSAGEPLIVATEFSERRDFRLSDESAVTLNADTKLSVVIDSRARTISLARGEALFDVAKDPARPFTVAAGPVTVTALGTVFSVDALNGDAQEIRVYEGQVHIDARGQDGRILQAGQWVVVEAGETVEGAFDPQSLRTWRNDWLEIEGMPLDLVVAKLNRYMTEQIQILDPSLADISLSGSFRLNDASQAQDMISALPEVEADAREGVIYLRRSRAD